MKVELRVGAAVVSCETDHRPDPSGKCSENDAARQALFERLLDVAIAQMNQWLYDSREPVGTPQPPSEYVRKLEKALEPVLAVEGAIEQAKRTDRRITCREDERLFQSLNAAAERERGNLDALERACEEVLDADTLKAVVAAKVRACEEVLDADTLKAVVAAKVRIQEVRAAR